MMKCKSRKKGFIPIAIALIGLLVLAFLLGFLPTGQIIIGTKETVCWDIDNPGGHTGIDPCLRYCQTTWTEGFNDQSQCEAYRQSMSGNPQVFKLTGCSPWTDPLRGGTGWVTEVGIRATEPYPNPRCPSPTTTITTMPYQTTTTTAYSPTTTTYSPTTTTMPVIECGSDIFCHISRFISSLGRIFRL